MDKKHIVLPFMAVLFTVSTNAQNWLLNGTGLTNPGTNNVGAQTDGHFIGTTDNNGLVIGTNNTKRAIIDLSGNLYGGSGTLMLNGTTNSFAWVSGISIGLSSAAHYSASFGLQNSIDAPYSFITGYSNKVIGYNSISSAAVGMQNTIGASSAFAAGSQNIIGTGAYNGAVFGWSNNINGQFGFAANQQNTIGLNGGAGAAFGWGNIVNSMMGFAAGQQNLLNPDAYAGAAFGYGNINNSKLGFAAGQQNTLAATAISGTVFGNYNTITGNTSAAFGQNNTCGGMFGFVAGSGNSIGGGSYAGSGFTSSAFGTNNTNNGIASMATGTYNVIGPTANDATTFGFLNKVNAINGIAGGQSNTVYEGAQNALAFGYYNNVYAQQALTNGQFNYVGATAINSTTIGYANSNGGGNPDGSRPSFIMGSSCTVTGKNSLAFGYANGVGNDNSMAIGNGISTDADNQFAANFIGGYKLMGGNVGIGITNPSSKLEILSSPDGSQLTSSTQTDIVTLRTPYVGNPYIYSGAGYKWGIKFSGWPDASQGDLKTASVYAVSEDSGSGFNRMVGLAFHTSSFDQPQKERMRITNIGNVGIGTNAPTAKLEVNSGVANTSGLKLTNLTSVSPVTTSPTATLGVDADGNVVAAPGNLLPAYETTVPGSLLSQAFNLPTYANKDATLDFFTNDTHQGNGFGLLRTDYMASPIVWLYNNTPNAFTVGIKSYTDGGVSKALNNITTAFQVRQDGLVGINTATPQARLDIGGNIRINDGTQAAGKVLTSDATGTASWQYPSGGGTSVSTSPAGANKNIQFNNNGSFGANPNLQWDNAAYGSNGGLKIGMVSGPGADSYLLNVAGPVRADKLTVNTTGADFVFDPSYKLKPLMEVEKYVNENRHLPDIAPAAEMQKNGVDVGDIQTKLLQKIEELTKYAIQQDKLMAEQQKNIEVLTKQLTEQGKQIKELSAKSK